jgi:hypothetical protein
MSSAEIQNTHSLKRKNSGLLCRPTPTLGVWQEPCVLTNNNLKITNKIGAYSFLSVWNNVGYTLFETHSWIPSAWIHFREKRVLLVSVRFCEWLLMLSERENKSASHASARYGLVLAQYWWRLTLTRHANYLALLKLRIWSTQCTQAFRMVFKINNCSFSMQCYADGCLVVGEEI